MTTQLKDTIKAVIMLIVLKNRNENDKSPEATAVQSTENTKLKKSKNITQLINLLTNSFIFTVCL